MREPKNAVNFASKTWSIGIGGGFTLSLGACLYIFWLYWECWTLSFLSWRFVYWQHFINCSLLELIKLQHVYSTCTCVLMILDAPRSAYGLKFPRRQSHIHRWARLIKPRSKAEPCPYETQTGSRYPRHPPLGRPPRRRTLRPTPLRSKKDAFLLSINR